MRVRACVRACVRVCGFVRVRERVHMCERCECVHVCFLFQRTIADTLALPLFLSGGRCAEIGDRKCHIVVLRNEQTVEWDEDLPPALGEQFAKGV